VPDRVLFVFAHPDDESMGTGGTIARHVRAGVEVHLLCLTRGGAGWGGRPPGRRPDELPAIRTGELDLAAKVLGLASVELWDYPDGGVPSCNQDEITRRIGEHVRSLQPGVVVGWGPDGGYFHPDHIACGACTDEALAGTGVPVYHFVLNPYLAAGYRHLVSLSGHDPKDLQLCIWERTSATFRCNAQEMDVKMRAIACHVSQLDDGWDQVIRREVEIRGLETESFMRVRDTNPADLVLDAGVFPELG
jgi:LmbE family N-acetylglucosaminyl deacetylase